MRAERNHHSPETLAEAAWDNLIALNLSLRGSREVTVFEESGHFRWLAAGVPHEFYNGVVCSAPVDERSPDLVASTIETFRAASSPLAWWPTSAPIARGWDPLLVKLGFRARHDLPLMAVDLANLRLPEGGLERFEIRLIRTDDELRRWARAFMEGNGWPETWAEPFYRLYRDLITSDGEHRCYALEEGGEPIATSSVFFHDGVAGIYDVATRRAARGRGLGSAITLAPLLAARDEGFRTGVLQSSALGLRVYERIGFHTVGHISCFSWEPSVP